VKARGGVISCPRTSRRDAECADKFPLLSRRATDSTARRLSGAASLNAATKAVSILARAVATWAALDPARLPDLLNVHATRLLHRELTFTGAVTDETSYSSRLLACLAVVNGTDGAGVSS
jgi:hypothetical protein